MAVRPANRWEFVMWGLPGGWNRAKTKVLLQPAGNFPKGCRICTEFLENVVSSYLIINEKYFAYEIKRNIVLNSTKTDI
jgi:hypothetical protein